MSPVLTDTDFDRIIESVEPLPCDVALERETGDHRTDVKNGQPCPRQAEWIIRVRAHCPGDEPITWLLCDWHKVALTACSGWCDYCGESLPSVLPYIERIEPLRQGGAR